MNFIHNNYYTQRHQKAQQTSLQVVSYLNNIFCLFYTLRRKGFI